MGCDVVCFRLMTQTREETKICEELVDTRAWVSLGLERQPDAAAGAAVGTLVVAEGSPDVDEGAQAVPAPIQHPNHHMQLD
nr:hypothetical protein [Tanacetum cinerariifolium]